LLQQTFRQLRQLRLLRTFLAFIAFVTYFLSCVRCCMRCVGWKARFKPGLHPTQHTLRKARNCVQFLYIHIYWSNYRQIVIQRREADKGQFELTDTSPCSTQIDDKQPYRPIKINRLHKFINFTSGYIPEIALPISKDNVTQWSEKGLVDIVRLAENRELYRRFVSGTA